MQALGFKISSVTLFWFCVQWSWGTIRNKNVFCDKFSCLIWTQIKENRNKHENETLYIRACMYMYFVAWILFKLVNVAMFSKTGKQFLKQYKITSSQMFLNNIEATFVLLFCIGPHVNILLGWKPTIIGQLFVRHLKSVPDCTAHTMQHTTWQTGDAKRRFSYIHVQGSKLKKLFSRYLATKR